MSAFAVQVACHRPMSNEPLFCIYAAPVGLLVLQQNIRIVEAHREAPKNNEERTKLERSSAKALHVLETEHHVD